MIVRLLSPLKLFAAAVFAAALIFGLADAPRAAAADDRLQFTGATLSGAPFNGASLQGKPAVLWFWTPWCPFCNAEAPGVSQVAAANPAVTFVGVAAHSDGGRDPEFIVTGSLDEAPDDGTSVGQYDDDGGTWRVTLRLPEGLRSAVEAAARRDGASLNAWLVRAAARASQGAGQGATRTDSGRSARTSGHRVTGWVR
jgi:thiol-disulfide isomerase/thioredoxin